MKMVGVCATVNYSNDGHKEGVKTSWHAVLESIGPCTEKKWAFSTSVLLVSVERRTAFGFAMATLLMLGRPLKSSTCASSSRTGWKRKTCQENEDENSETSGQCRSPKQPWGPHIRASSVL